MIDLKSRLNLNKVNPRYLYAKNGVIFKISATDDGDSCAKKLEANESIRIRVTDGAPGAGPSNLYYLDSFIQVGDTLSGEGSSMVITRTDHEVNPESGMTFQEYYQQLCTDNIQEAITTQYDKTYEDFVKYLDGFGIPLWMISGQSGTTGVYTLDPNIQIDFTEEYFNGEKEKRVQELAYEAACEQAEMYGYKVTSTLDQLIVSNESDTTEEHYGTDELG